MGYTDTTLLLPLSQQQQPPHNNETSSLLNNSQTDDIKILSPIVNRQQIKGQQVVIVDSSIYGSFSSSTDSDVEQRTSIVSCYNQKNGLCLHSNNDNIVVADHDDDYGDDTKQCHNGTMVSGMWIDIFDSLEFVLVAFDFMIGQYVLITFSFDIWKSVCKKFFISFYFSCFLIGENLAGFFPFFPFFFN